jgi:hypothetical protein
MIPYPSHLPSPQPDAVARKVLLVSAAVTLALYMIPFGRYLARPLLLLSTLAHEMGHGITALLLGGSFRRLAVWPSGAGLADLDIAGFGRIRQGLTLAGGLVGPSVAAALCFALGKTGQGARWCLLGVGLLLAAAEILVVRNLFGLFFAGVIAAGCLFAGLRCSPEVAQWVVVFLGVQLALSVFSRADYLFKKTAANPSGIYPSDVLQMQYALFLPYWLWGFVCGAFAVLVLLYGLRTFWGR